MGKVKILARDWRLYILDPAATPTSTFNRIAGVDSFTLSNDYETTDTADFDSEGYDEHIVSGRSFEVKLEGSYMVDVASGDRDNGQSLVEALAKEIGPSSISKFRLVSPAKKVTEYSVSAKVEDIGGGLKDKTSWGATFKVSGKPVDVAAGDTAVYHGVDGAVETLS